MALGEEPLGLVNLREAMVIEAYLWYWKRNSCALRILLNPMLSCRHQMISFFQGCARQSDILRRGPMNKAGRG